MIIQKYSKEFKQKARRLRKSGLSYKEIAGKLNIGKSTAKLWCCDVVLNVEDKKRLYNKQIEVLSRGPNSSHERRQREINTILENAGREIKLPLSLDTYRLVGAALYWAEGNKTTHFSITNSDPYLVKFVVQWMSDVLKISPKNLKAHLNIYPQQNESEIKKFWSDTTEIPLQNFGKSFIKPVNKGYKKNTLYYGTIKIRAFRGTDFRYRVFGWIDAVLKNTKTKVENVEKKWHNLKNYKRP